MIKDTIVDGFHNAPHRSLYHACGLTKEEINNRISVLDVEYFITEGIIEWEKMNKTY